LVEIEALNYKNEAFNGRKYFHLANNYGEIRKLELLELAQEHQTECDPLYNFKTNALLAKIHIENTSFDKAIISLKRNDSYCKILNDVEVRRHHYQLYQTYYHYSGQEAKAHFYEKEIFTIEKTQNDLKRKGELKDLVANELSESNRELNKKNTTLIIALSTIVALLALILVLMWRLIQNRKKLKQTNLHLNQLFQIISHDIQSPLSYAISLVQKENSSKNSILNVLQDLRDKTNSILTWASKNSQKQNIKEQKFEVNKVLYQELEHFESILDQKNIEVIITGSCEIKSDPSLLAIILRNALDNAIKYSPTYNDIIILLKNTSAEIVNEIDSDLPSGTQKGLLLIESIAGSIGVKVFVTATTQTYSLKLLFRD